MSALDAGSNIEFSAPGATENNYEGVHSGPSEYIDRGYLVNPCTYCNKNAATTRSKIGNEWKQLCDSCYTIFSPTRATSKFTALPLNQKRTLEFKT